MSAPDPASLEAVLATVYSLYWPEVRRLVTELWISQPHEMYDFAWQAHQAEPKEPFLERWPAWAGVRLGTAFPWSYPTNGASEGISHLILTCRGRIHVFKGEYEGYRAMALADEREVVVHDRKDLDAVFAHPFKKGDQFWVSNPSAIDGEHWEGFDAWCREMARVAPEVEIMLDLTYVGAVSRPVALAPEDHPNVAAVLFSLSKPFGVYYHRVGGLFSRRERKTLYGNRWFKNKFSLLLAERLLERFAVDALPRRYQATQLRAIRNLVEAGRLPKEIVPSNVVLLAHANAGDKAFERLPDLYRFCVTVEMRRLIAEGVPS